MVAPSTPELRRWAVGDGIFALGDVEVERGGVIRDARLAWQTHGSLNAARDNVIVYPCSYTATHDDLGWLIGPEGILDPYRWFVVIPDMFSNGLSSGAAQTADYPPLVTVGDNEWVRSMDESALRWGTVDDGAGAGDPRAVTIHL